VGMMDLRSAPIGGFIEDDFDSSALDDAHDGFVGAQVDSYRLCVS